MARKKRKREKAEAVSQLGEWTSPAPDEADESEVPDEIVSRRDAHSEEDRAAGVFPAADKKGGNLASPPKQEWEPSSPPAPPRKPQSVLARISRWFQGESEPADVPPPTPAPTPEPKIDAEPLIAPQERSPERSLADREPAFPPPAQAGASNQPSGTAASKVDHILAMLTLERVLPELEAARKEIEELKLSSSQRIRQLEAERDELRGQLSAEAEQARAAAPDPDAGAADRLRFEEQLAEQQKAAEERIRQLESERDQSRSETERALAAQRDPNLRIRQSKATLGVQRPDRSAEEVRTLQSRVLDLEEKMNAARLQADQERKEARARFVQVESERNQAAANLAAKEKKLLASLGQIEEVQEQAQKLAAELTLIKAERDQLSSRIAEKEEKLLTTSKLSDRIRELETELTAWKDRATSRPSEESQPPPEPLPAAPAADAARLAELYQQTMSRLTVIQASAELLAMNSRLDASSRETAKEICSASQLLSEIIRNFALPPDTCRAE